MVEIYNYVGQIPYFMDVIVNGTSIAQIDYADFDFDDVSGHITLYDGEKVEFANIVCDNLVIIP